MSWDFDENRPIFQQITEHIAMEIVSGKYKPGDKLPSVRELAIEAGVNPNTMQRALAQLEADGLAEANRTTGRIVTSDKKVITKVRMKLAMNAASEYLDKAKQLGLNEGEVLEIIRTLSEEGTK
ncbi:MAG: GntR family transcriptional regulator [Clostridia bacterium]|nr:GntR family transcriptional regulator [Clostridia bacterium]